MSIGGNGDDDIEEKLDNIIEQLRNLNSNFSRLFEAAQEGPDEENIRGGDDRWDQGNIKPVADGNTTDEAIEEYKAIRRGAAQNTRTVRPTLSRGPFDSTEDWLFARVELFREGFDSLESLMGALTQDQFDKFFSLYAIRDVGVSKDLIDLLDPRKEIFGVSVVEDNILGPGGVPVAKTEIIAVDPTSTPFDFLIAYGEHYDGDSIPWSGSILDIDPPFLMDRFNSVQDLKESAEQNLIPQDAGVGFIDGQLGVGSMETKIAEAIFDKRVRQEEKAEQRDDFEADAPILPKRFAENLLPLDKRSEWQRRYG